MEDGSWMLSENSSVAGAVAVLAHPGWRGDAETLAFPELKCSPQAAFDFFNYGFGVSGIRGWMRLVKRAPNDEIQPKLIKESLKY